MRTTKGIAVSMAVIVMLFFVSLLINDNVSANLAGDENQLPSNETLLDLSGGSTYGGDGIGYEVYRKGDYFVWGADGGGYNGKMFDGTHAMGYVNGYGTYQKFLTIHFPQPLKIKRIRVYPMGTGNEMDCTNNLEICKPIHFWKYYNTLSRNWYSGCEHYRLSRPSVANIQQATDYVQVRWNNGLITDSIMFNFPNNVQSQLRLNEIEIYYDNTFNPYPYESELRNYYNSTNITNEYYNETNFYNETYVTYKNETYLNETYLDYDIYKNETYSNKTYQNDTYTGEYTDITYENDTHQYYMNQTGGALYQNTTEFINYTYLNETLKQDSQRLEDKLNDVLNRLNNTQSTSTKESTSTESVFTDPFLIVMLVLIVLLQLIIIFRKRKKGEIIETRTGDSIEPEIEHPPQRGFTREEEKQIIGYGEHPPLPPLLEGAPDPSIYYGQYEHRVNSPVQTIPPPESSLVSDFSIREPNYQAPQSQKNVMGEPPMNQTSPDIPPIIPREPVKQQYLPEHVATEEQPVAHTAPKIVGLVEDRLGDQKALPEAKLTP